MNDSTFIRINKDIKQELLLLTVSNCKKSMSEMIKTLVENYKKEQKEND